MTHRIVTRADAGLRETEAIAHLDLLHEPVPEIWVHHSVTTVSPDPLADWREVQAVAFGRGFTDVSYSFGVHPGLPEAVLEGRGLRVGAHTLDHNSRSFGIVLVGNYEVSDLPDSMVDSVRWITWHLKDQGHLVPGAEIGPHRSVYATACPGQHAMARLDQMRVPWVPEGPRPPMPAPVVPPPPPVPGPPPVPAWTGRLMRRGMSGEDVRRVQARLRERGWAIGRVDGDFGPQTEAVVRNFQREKHLAVDGIVGPATWRALWVDPIT